MSLVTYKHITADDHTDPCAGESASGCQVDKPGRGSPSLGPQSLAHQAPSGAQVSLCDQSLKPFVRCDSPISQSVAQAEPQVVGDSAEAVGSGRAPTCASVLIPHTGGDLSRVGRSSSDVEYDV